MCYEWIIVIVDPTPTCQSVVVRGDPRPPSTDLGNTPGPSGGIPGQQPHQVVWQGGITVTEPVSVDRFELLRVSLDIISGCVVSSLDFEGETSIVTL